jgi:hypothetical protein
MRDIKEEGNETHEALSPLQYGCQKAFCAGTTQFTAGY